MRQRRRTASTTPASGTATSSRVARFFTFHSPRSNSAGAGDDRDAEAAVAGVLQLLADLDRVGVDLGADARRAQQAARGAGSRRRARRGTARSAPARAWTTFGSTFDASRMPSSRSRPSDAPTPGSVCFVYRPGEVVVAPAGADAAVTRTQLLAALASGDCPAGTSRRSCRCSSPGRARSTGRGGSAPRARRRPASRRAVRAAWRCPRRPWRCRRTRALSRSRMSALLPSSEARARTRPACSRVTPAFSTISAATSSALDLAELVEAAQDVAARHVRMPSSSSRPLRTRRLLTRIWKSPTSSAVIRSWMTRATSMSAALEVVPMVSKSHCQNSR